MRPVLLKIKCFSEVSLTPPDIAKLWILQALTGVISLQYGVFHLIWNWTAGGEFWFAERVFFCARALGLSEPFKLEKYEDLVCYRFLEEVLLNEGE